MLELLIAVVTGWLAFQTEHPTTFGEFVIFFFIWVVYFVIARAIIGGIITLLFDSKS